MFTPSPKTPQDYRERAEECDRLATNATNPEVRETMLYIARRWRALADEDEARKKPLKPKTHVSTPPD